MNEHAALLRAYLEELCVRLERRERAPHWATFRRRALAAAVPVAVGLAVASCNGDTEADGSARECSGDECSSLCADKLDNDADRLVDCADSDCASAAVCASGARYAIVMPETQCADRIDDDGDGSIDCADSDCLNDLLCRTQPDYGVPLGETNCTDRLDNDGDGAIDCDDADCICGEIPVYSIFMKKR